MMATDGPTPPPCDSEIFQRGAPVCLVTGPSNAVERWVHDLHVLSDSRVDWHYSGGIAQVLHLGDPASRRRVYESFQRMPLHPGVRLIKIFDADERGLYRANVTEAPADARVAMYDGGGESTYITLEETIG